MASCSIPSTLTPIFASHSYYQASSSSSSFSFSGPKVKCKFVGSQNGLSWFRPSSLTGSSGSCGWRATCWFKFGKNGVDSEGAGIYGSQRRDDFDRDDVEQYFNYMGMLAVEGTYDKMEALLSQNIHPVDILLMMAASEGDTPKIEELLRAGAVYTVKDANGLTALDKAANEEIKDLILNYSAQKA